MLKAADYLKQRAEDTKLLKDFREIDKEKKTIKDLMEVPVGVESLKDNSGYKFIYPSPEDFYTAVVKGNMDKYSKFLRGKDKEKLNDVITKNSKDMPNKIGEIYNSIFKKAFQLENHLNDFIYDSNQYKKEKGQNIAYLVEEVIEGKIDGFDFLRAPIVFKEATFKRDVNKREVKITYNSSDKIIPNIHLFYELSAKVNKPIENMMNELPFDKDNYKESITELLKYLNVEFDWDLIPLQYIRLNNNTNNMEAKFEHALNLFVDLERYRFLGLTVDEVSLSDSAVIEDASDSHKKILYLTETEEAINELLNTELEFDEDEYDEDSSDLYDIPDGMFDENWKNEHKEINKKFLDSINVSSIDALKESEKAVAFAKQIIASKPISWTTYLEFVEDGIDFMEETDIDVKVNNSAKIKGFKYLFKTEKLQSRKLTKDIKEVIDGGIIEEIESKRGDEFNGAMPNESEINWTYPSDYTQRKAVRSSISSKMHIIQGPPGTGKTQTILNIITELVRNNKKVLIVSEKKTAVEVIANRLKEGDVNLFPSFLELYRDNDILNNIKELSKIVDLMSSKIEMEKIGFHSNSSILIEVDEFVETANSLTTEDLNLIDELIANNITFEDIVNAEKFLKMEVETKEKYDSIVENKGLRDRAVRALHDTGIYSEETITEIFNSQGDEIKVFLAIHRFNKKPWWWTNGKLVRKAGTDEKTQRVAYELFDSLQIQKINSRLLEEDYSKLIIENSEPIWNFIQEMGDSIDVIKKLNKLSKLIANSELFNYEKFKNEKVLDENKRIILNKLKDQATIHLGGNVKLKREMDKLRDRQKVTKVVRNFITDNWKELFKLFPITIATVETVSEYVPLKKEMFDYVIIDEASQIFTERALPSIWRAKNLIISGDKEQLRPYSENASSKITNEALENGLEVDHKSWIEHESLLDLFSEIVGSENQSLLKIHYRSNNYGLIKYSNDNFYNSELSFVPKPLEVKENPIKLIRVEHDWENQVSMNEIAEIIKLLNKMVKDGKDSIGIIAMSKKQTQYLRREILQKANQNVVDLLTNSDGEGIFIKPLNDVQGDERDYIIFSIGYDGVRANYAYINQSYGANRLNVAASRARKQMIVVMNGDPEKMSGRDNNNPGTDAFLNFIDFVKDNSSTKQTVAPEETLIKELERVNIKEYEILSDGQFTFAAYDFNKAFFVLDKFMLSQTKEYLWKYLDLLETRGYEPHYSFPLEEKIKKFNDSKILQEIQKEVKKKINVKTGSNSIW